MTKQAKNHKERRDSTLNAELLAALTELVSALNETPWSSWQSTYHFMPQLDAANDLLAKIAEARP